MRIESRAASTEPGGETAAPADIRFRHPGAEDQLGL